MTEMSAEQRRPPFADEVGALYALIGQAVWHLQHLEDALSTAIAIKMDLKEAALGSVPPDRASDILAKRRRPTLGVAVGLAREKSIFDEQLQQRLEEFLEERNWLVHRLVHQNSGDMNVSGRRELLLSRVDNIAIEARRLQGVIGDDLMAFVVAKGAKEKAILEQAQGKFLKSRGLL